MPILFSTQHLQDVHKQEPKRYNIDLEEEAVAFMEENKGKCSGLEYYHTTLEGLESKSEDTVKVAVKLLERNGIITRETLVDNRTMTLTTKTTYKLTFLLY